MYYYLIVEAKHDIPDSWSFVADFFEQIVDIVYVEKDSKCIIMHLRSTHQMDFSDMIYHMIAETYYDLRLYQSYRFNDQQQLTSHAAYIKSLLEKIPFNVNTFIDDQSLLQYMLSQGQKINRSYFFQKYHHNSEMLHTIKTFLEHNQNINQTAAQLYIHRNTLLQRLDKFHQATGFDIKKFKDAFIVYQLL